MNMMHLHAFLELAWTVRDLAIALIFYNTLSSTECVLHALRQSEHFIPHIVHVYEYSQILLKYRKYEHRAIARYSILNYTAQDQSMANSTVAARSGPATGQV